MGGYNSGRRGGKDCTEDMRQVDVRRLQRDGYLNPGFDVSSSATLTDINGLGYADNTVELPPSLFSGVFIEKQGTKGNLD